MEFATRQLSFFEHKGSDLYTALYTIITVCYYNTCNGMLCEEMKRLKCKLTLDTFFFNPQSSAGDLH